MAQPNLVLLSIQAGLCATCLHARPVASSKGTTYVRCELSFSDRRFPRYPTLPVRTCEGHGERTEDG